MLTNITLLSLIIVLGIFVANFYFELRTLNSRLLEIQEQIHHLNNEVSRLKQQAKKKYYSKPKSKQVIHG